MSIIRSTDVNSLVRAIEAQVKQAAKEFEHAKLPLSINLDYALKNIHKLKEITSHQTGNASMITTSTLTTAEAIHHDSNEFTPSTDSGLRSLDTDCRSDNDSPQSVASLTWSGGSIDDESDHGDQVHLVWDDGGFGVDEVAWNHGGFNKDKLGLAGNGCKVKELARCDSGLHINQVASDNGWPNVGEDVGVAGFGVEEMVWDDGGFGVNEPGGDDNKTANDELVWDDGGFGVDEAGEVDGEVGDDELVWDDGGFGVNEPVGDDSDAGNDELVWDDGGFGVDELAEDDELVWDDGGFGVDEEAEVAGLTWDDGGFGVEETM